MSGSLYIHASCNMKLTTPCETMLSQFFKNLANIFFVVSASCSTSSEFHLDVDAVLQYCLPNYFAAILFPQYTHLAL